MYAEEEASARLVHRSSERLVHRSSDRRERSAKVGSERFRRRRTDPLAEPTSVTRTTPMTAWPDLPPELVFVCADSALQSLPIAILRRIHR